MRKMGGLRRKIPGTFAMMLIGTLAITGVGAPFLYILDVPIRFAGFVSKDVILESAWASDYAASGYAFTLLLVAAFFTSFYSWRLMFMTFWGETRADHHTFEHAHESPQVMMIPLYLLALGAALAGMEFYPDFVGHHEGAFWGPAIFNAAENHVLHDSHDVAALVKLSPFLAMAGGLALAYWFYRVQPALPGQLAARHHAAYQFLLNKWYFDELYDRIFVRPAMALGRFLWKKGDGATIDGAINGLALGAVPYVTRLAGRAQSGYLYHYAFVMLIGVSLLITWYAVTGS
jgi:NADH-quinone oxidoreductase subunit L